ncbi:hypothetical protein [Cohnella cholangitidis]|uniref:Uncharacterized protein n=1 Tax=Cohnella cholangitidis TaxID=2598458 RepID=A0A7G5C3D9_9BACL|nr:hypothetical protein [Cohnella cholangitidis]QMV43723.1 hypothetical protein FPL14_23030 [Cohnella cholangitidis]
MKAGEEGWFSTFELPPKTAMLVKEEKEKKHFVRMDKQANGNYIVKYRGLTEAEKADKKRQEKMMKNIVG